MGLLNKEQYTKVCKIGQGAECCRYITAGIDGLSCEKLNPGIKHILDMRVESMNAKGDNCQGI